jgi:hypothetical protein
MICRNADRALFKSAIAFSNNNRFVTKEDENLNGKRRVVRAVDFLVEIC